MSARNEEYMTSRMCWKELVLLRKSPRTVLYGCQFLNTFIVFYLVYPSILFVLFLCYASLSSLELSSVYYHCTVSAPVFQITSLIVVIIIYVASRQWYLLFRKYNSCQHCSVLNCIFLSYMFLYLSTRLYVHPYVRPSVHKSNSDLNKIWFVGRGR